MTLNAENANNNWREANEAPPAGHNSDPGPDTTWSFNAEAFGVDQDAIVSKTSMARFEAAIREQGDRKTRLRAIDQAMWRWRQRLTGNEFKLYSAFCDLAKMGMGSKDPRAALLGLGRMANICGVNDPSDASKIATALEEKGAIVSVRWMVGKKRRGFFSPTVTAEDRRHETAAAIIEASKAAEDDKRQRAADRKRRWRQSVAPNTAPNDVPEKTQDEVCPGKTGGTVPEETVGQPDLSRKNGWDKGKCPAVFPHLVSTYLGSSEVAGSTEGVAATPPPPPNSSRGEVERSLARDETAKAVSVPASKQVATCAQLALVDDGEITIADPSPHDIAKAAKRCGVEQPTEAQQRHITDVLRKAAALWTDAEIAANGRRRIANRTWAKIDAWFVANWLPRLREDLQKIEKSAAAASGGELEKLFSSPKAMTIGKDWIHGDHCSAAFNRMDPMLRPHCTRADFIAVETKLRTAFEAAPADIPGAIASRLNGTVLFRIRGPLSKYCAGPYWRISKSGTWAIPRALAERLAKILAERANKRAWACGEHGSTSITVNHLLDGELAPDLVSAFARVETRMDWHEYGSPEFQKRADELFETYALGGDDLSPDEKLKSGHFDFDAEGRIVPKPSRSAAQSVAPRRRGFNA